MNLASSRRVQLNHVYVTALNGRVHRQFHSSRSNRVDVVSSIRWSSFRSRIKRAASCQPSRGRLAERMTIRPGSAFNSTSSRSCASAMMVFGRRIPLEFPIFTSRVFTVAPTFCFFLRNYIVFTGSQRLQDDIRLLYCGPVGLYADPAAPCQIRLASGGSSFRS